MARNDLGPDSFQLRLFFGESSTASIGGDGNDLLDSWELESQAVAFNQGADSTGFVPGPASTDNAALDTTERYFWSPPTTRRAVLNEFFFTTIDTGQDVRLTLRLPYVRAGAGEAGAVAAAGIEGAGRKLDAATRTGTGEAGTVAAAGVEGAGRKLDAGTVTGAGEAGTVAVAGIEGTGRKLSGAARTGDGEAGAVAVAGIEGTGRKLDAAARTGTGEAGTAAAAGIEGTGIFIRVRTGTGEAGSVQASGIEGAGREYLARAATFRYIPDFVIQRDRDVDILIPRVANEYAGGTYSVSGLPSGLTFDSATFRITGRTSVAAGDFNVTISYA